MHLYVPLGIKPFAMTINFSPQIQNLYGVALLTQKSYYGAKVVVDFLKGPPHLAIP